MAAVGAAPVRDMAEGLGLAATGLAHIVENDGASELDRARAQWFFGEWEALAALDVARWQQHPDRARLALLHAAAQLQMGQADAARLSARQALQWGCSPRLLSQVLVAGVHNSLGRARALARQDSRAALHFKAAVTVGEGAGGADALMGHTRSVRELTKLGLLPQATALMDQSLAAAADRSQRPALIDARLKALQSEFEVLRGSLSLAASRGQLPLSPTRSADPAFRASSQLGQDLWVLETTGYKRGGYFVEFGATDGVLLSNTLLLERDYGWQGICAEPHPEFFRRLRANRQCKVVDVCVGAHSGEQVEFILAEEYGGIAAHAGDDSHADKRESYRRLGRTMQVNTLSLHDLLLSQGAPHDIDYLSIDTEGSEYAILSAFPFDAWRIRCITVEHNFSKTREPIRQLLEPLGYRRREAQWDDWYVLDDGRQ